MSRRALTILMWTLAAAALATPVAIADGGPTPGFAGGTGVSTHEGKLRYVTLSAAGGTVVEAIDAHGAVLRYNWLPGPFGVPLVAFDGSAGGLSHDGKRLVLVSYAAPTVTEFAVLRTSTLSVAKSIQLNGFWSFDALSPDAKTMYLIQYLRPNYSHYRVLAYDVARGRLVGGVIADKTETGAMVGSPLVRLTRANGSWAYTLYVRPKGTAFVHALDTVHRSAVCIDLPWKTWSSRGRVELRFTAGERKLVASVYGKPRPFAVVDTRTFRVTVAS